MLALVVDHGLRDGSAAEARLTLARLAARGIPGRLLTLTGLSPGPALAARARRARLAALTEACREQGILHLLLGHHAADQAETLLMRSLGGSGAAGFAGIPALREADSVRLLRPLLGAAPERLREFLRSEGMACVEDPSNRDVRALRGRLRGRRSATQDDRELAGAAGSAGAQRAAAERRWAALLARRVAVFPEGYAVLSPGPLPAGALAALLQALSGAPFPVSVPAGLAASPHPATLGGIRLLPAGRLGPGLLLVREEAVRQGPVAARPGAVWDRRFRVPDSTAPPADATIDALADGAAGLRRFSPLPACVLRNLPALRRGAALLAVPHIGYPDPATCAAVPVLFSPARPAAGAPWFVSPNGDAREPWAPYVYLR